MTDEPTSDMDYDTLALIGSIITTWSQVEFCLERLIWAITGMSDHHGRMLTSLMSMKAKQEALTEMLTGDTRDAAVDVREVLPVLTKMADDRNRIAHGVWVRDSSTGNEGLMTTRTRPTPLEPPPKGTKPKRQPRRPGLLTAQRMSKDEMIHLKDAIMAALDILGPAIHDIGGQPLKGDARP